jgi:hypothetical protein
MSLPDTTQVQTPAQTGGCGRHKLGFLSPILTLIAADVALRAGHKVVRQAVEHGCSGTAASKARLIRGNSVKETVVATAIAEVARRSVPGAIVVGGVLLAKFLHSRRAKRRPRASAAQGELNLQHDDLRAIGPAQPGERVVAIPPANESPSGKQSDVSPRASPMVIACKASRRTPVISNRTRQAQSGHMNRRQPFSAASRMGRPCHIAPSRSRRQPSAKAT